MAADERYAFAQCALDVSERRLSRAGHAIALAPKAHDLLVMLVRHGRVLTKRELLTSLCRSAPSTKASCLFMWRVCAKPSEMWPARRDSLKPSVRSAIASLLPSRESTLSHPACRQRSLKAPRAGQDDGQRRRVCKRGDAAYCRSRSPSCPRLKRRFVRPSSLTRPTQARTRGSRWSTAHRLHFASPPRWTAYGKASPLRVAHWHSTTPAPMHTSPLVRSCS